MLQIHVRRMSTKGRRRKRRRSHPDTESESEYAPSDADENEEIDEVEQESHDPPPRKRKRRNPSRGNKSEQQSDGGYDSDEPPSDSENEMAALKAENQTLKKRIKELENLLKSTRSTTAFTTTTVRSPPQTVNGKKQFAAFAKSLKRIAKLKKTKFYGDGDITVESTGLNFDEFTTLFDGKGEKVQPTPNNKPKSIKTIIQFRDWKAVKGLFSDYDVGLEQELDVSYWRMGGLRRGKSRYLGTTEAKVQSLTVEYNKSKKNLKLNFYVSAGLCGIGAFFL